MFGHLAGWTRIAVTGPQRAGTTITAKIIADDLGYRYVDETDYHVYDADAWARCLEDSYVVVHSPVMLPALVDHPEPGTLAVLVRRPLPEIHASRDRIGWWPHEPLMLGRLGATSDSAAAAYAYWDANPPPERLEVDYHSLAAHPLWVADRRHFTVRQTA